MTRSIVLVVLLLSACGGSKPPASSSPSPSPPPAGGGPVCKDAYNPPLCSGERRCQVDPDGCERCTCDGLTPLAPGAEGH